MNGKTLCVLFVMIMVWALPAHAQAPQDWYEEGLKAESSRRYESALNAYSESIKENPSFAPAYLKRGTLLFSLSPNRAVEAFNDLSTAIELDPENGDAFYERGRLSFFMLKNEDGREDMIKAAGLGHEGAREWLEAPAATKQSGYVHLGSYIEPERPPIAFFAYDQAELDETAKTLLDDIALILRNELRDVVVYIAGHADDHGSDEYNSDLSLRRAESVKKYLSLQGGVRADRLVIRYYGESSPLQPNETAEGRAMNRRVELMALKRH
ncbi:MAG TPA: hypothetical protein ENN35_08805 [Deltaproteobacteria bacterium]|nr:hypothetical protein [Deltaproteobacteria bacterium]